MSSEGEQKRTSPGLKQVKLRLAIPGAMTGLFANNLIVQQDEYSAFLNFYLAHPPFVTGTQEEVQEQLEKLDTIEGKIVAQVIIPREQLEPFARAMLENVAQLKGSTGDQEPK